MLKKLQNSQPATKKDIQGLDGRIDKLDGRIDGVEKRLVVKLDKLQNTLDGFVGRVDNLTIENQVGTNQISELREHVENHEKRITNLETSNQTA